ncbi:MAG TPA: class I SAM-dependent methyltransferase [Flavobacterium sp.]|uniref:class I SAM-dependent methyltransferase n=1 Tax=Flavobacterium sp. TaxID=239 RepID=UPI002ED2ECB8
MNQNSFYGVCKCCGAEIKDENQKFNLVKCNSCDLVFCRKIYTEKDFESVYNELYNATNPKYSKHSVEEFNNLKKQIVNIGYNRKILLSKIIKKHKQKFLEIGSGIGLVGVYLKSFKNIIYQGIEIDKATHEKALELEVNSINGDFSKMNENPEPVDIIMLWEVLEHIQDLKLFFELAKNKLAPKGKLVFSVPNYNKRLNYKIIERDDKIYQSGPPVHLNFFEEKSIKKVLDFNGFKTNEIKIKKIPYLDLRNKNFFNFLFKALIGKYHGSTIYVIAELK